MASTTPTSRRDGQKLPDEVQDRPDQNQGYDDAVRGTEKAKQQQDSEGIDDEDDFDDDDEDEDDEEEGDDEAV